MPTGYGLTVGLNSVLPSAYFGWPGNLTACQADANSMESLLKRRGFIVTKLLTASATREAVLGHLAEAAAKCVPGDIFVFTNSSHGGQLPDTNGDESDGSDETICLYDGELIDDELYAALGAFQAGVRVLVLSDSCHSGTVTRMFDRPRLESWSHDDQKVAARLLPPDVALATYHANQDYYDLLQSKPELKDARKKLKASVLLISGCMDNQTSMDGLYNGAFTGTLLKVWNGGAFKGSYKDLRNQIVRRMPADQTPNFYWACKRDSRFEQQTPFTI